MRIKARYLGAALAAAVVAAGTFVAVSAASAASAAPAPCGIKDVSFYYGGDFEGLGLRTFDITLLAHDGITCSLKDTPLLSVSGPSSTPITVSRGGRGGTLVLRSNSPLHAVVSYNAPDTSEDTVQVSTLTLGMPDGTSASTYFEFPGPLDIAKVGGVSITSWDTGIGPGEEAND